MNKLIRNFNFFFYRVFFTKEERKLIQKLEEITYKNNRTTQEMKKEVCKVVLQMPEDYFYLIKFFLFYKVLLLKNSSVEVSLIQLASPIARRGRFSFLLNLKLYDVKWCRLYQHLFKGKVIFNFHPYLGSKSLELRYLKPAREITDTIKTKDDVLRITYQGYMIGPLVYDYYLRVENKPTIDIESPILFEILVNSIRAIDYLDEHFKSKSYDYFLTSYISYTPHGIPCLVALRFGVKVYSFAGIDQFCFRIKSDFLSHAKNYLRYKPLKDKINEEQIAVARTKIEERYNGVVDLSTIYMKQSAYGLQNQQFEFDASKPIVVIFLHCFFDSPHLYRNMLFPDFFEWLDFSLSCLAKNSEVNVFIKKHPNALAGNDDIISQLLLKYPEVKVIPHDFNNLQVVNLMKPVAVLTVHGTVAHELAYLGIPVICAGDNPHIDFDFHITPKSRKDYELLLGKIQETRSYSSEELGEVKNEVLRFFYLHNYYQFLEKLSLSEQKEHDLIVGLFFSDGDLKQFNTNCKSDSFDLLFNKIVGQLESDRA